MGRGLWHRHAGEWYRGCEDGCGLRGADPHRGLPCLPHRARRAQRLAHHAEGRQRLYRGSGGTRREGGGGRRVTGERDVLMAGGGPTEDEWEGGAVGEGADRGCEGAAARPSEVADATAGTVSSSVTEEAVAACS